MSETGPGPGPGQIVGRRVQESVRATRFLVLFIGVAVVWALISGQWRNLLVIAAALVSSGWLQFRPTTVIDRSGIRRPGRLRRRVAWSDVDAVAAPQPGVFPARLVLTNGKFLKLDDIPAADSAAVAELGDRRVLRATPPPRRPPRTVIPTDQEIRADVARRAAALAVQRTTLEAERRRVTPARREEPPPASPGTDP